VVDFKTRKSNRFGDGLEVNDVKKFIEFYPENYQPQISAIDIITKQGQLGL
jgi:hypothetical protein